MSKLKSFYQSSKWAKFRLAYISKNKPICNICNRFIATAHNITLHHKTELDEVNVDDYTISLNEDNITLLCSGCHNNLHKGKTSKVSRQKVYIVHGSPLSGKTTWALSKATNKSLIIDLDSIIGGFTKAGVSKLNGGDGDIYKRDPLFLNGGGLQLKEGLIDIVATRNGNWDRAYIIGGYPYNRDRTVLASETGGELIHMEIDLKEALKRWSACTDYRSRIEYKKVIEKYFENYC